jgi:hypothetical protein
MTFYLEADEDDPIDPTLDEVKDAALECIGWTNTVPTAGALERHLPLCHPIYPNLVAYNVRITPVEDQADFEVTEADPVGERGAPPIHPDQVNWRIWRFDVSFAPRPYRIIADALLSRQDDEWYDEDGNLTSFSHWQEHYRYCDYLFTPRAEYMKARAGQFKFRTAGGGAPNNVPYTDFPRVLLPDDVLTIRWHMVPQRYILSSNSYLRRFRNYINQKEFSLGYSASPPYPVGSMLYLGYKDRPYTHPFAVLDEDWGGPDVYSAEKLVDIDLEFLITRREVTDPPVPSNPNWLSQGWNAFANMRYGVASSGGGFYYVSADGAGASEEYPFFLSAPLELLFVDPDAV